MGDVIFDLLGDPIPEGWGKRGRPPHVPTPEKRQIIVVLCAFGKSNEEIADALRISEPTLRKHYFRELRDRAGARQRLEAKLYSGLLKGVEEGNASSIDKLFKRLDRFDQWMLSNAVANRDPADSRKAKVKSLPPKGKKEQARDDARGVGGIFAPPEAPRFN